MHVPKSPLLWHLCKGGKGGGKGGERGRGEL